MYLFHRLTPVTEKIVAEFEAFQSLGKLQILSQGLTLKIMFEQQVQKGTTQL